MENKKYIDQLYRKYINDSITPKEFDILFDYWKKNPNEKKLDSFKALLLEEKSKVKNIKSKAKDRDKFLDDVMLTIDKRKDISPLSLINTKRKDRTWYKAAAVLALAILSFISVYHLLPDTPPKTGFLVYQTESRQKSTLTLSDGTTVKLNSNSKLLYPQNFNNSDVREVFLEGEAFFEVTPNANLPFVIKSSEVTTTVLGTSFNIRAYPEDDEIEIAVLTGKVAISINDDSNSEQPGNRILLTPNQMANYQSTRGFRKETLDITELIAWKDGILIFNDKTIMETAEILEKWYDVKVIVENKEIERCLFRGKFKNPSLTKVLESLKFIYDDMNYEFSGEQVVLSGKSCD